MAKIKPSTDPKALLLRIARFFEKYPDRWTRKAFARDKARYYVPSFAPSAYCFCARGALIRFGTDESTFSASKALNRTIGFENGIENWNDARGPRGVGVVARMFRKAAEAI